MVAKGTKKSSKKQAHRGTVSVRDAKINKAAKIVSGTTRVLPASYGDLLENLKFRIRTAQVKAALSVNRELIQLYWDIGCLIVTRQKTEGWGTKVINRLADDLQREFPAVGGFSRANVYRMRNFFNAYARKDSTFQQAAGKSPEQIVAQAVRQLADSFASPPAGQFSNSIVAQPVRQLPDASLPQFLAQIPWGQPSEHGRIDPRTGSTRDAVKIRPLTTVP